MSVSGRNAHAHETQLPLLRTRITAPIRVHDKNMWIKTADRFSLSCCYFQYIFLIPTLL